MKTVIRAWNLSVSMLLLILILGCFIQKEIIQSELRSVVSDSLVQATRVILDKRYLIENNDEFIAEFEQCLLQNIRAVEGMELDIYLLGVDVDKGVISVVVEERVPYVLLPEKKIKINTQQSLIIDNTDEEMKWHKIRYHNVSKDELPFETPYVHINGIETTLPVPIRPGYVFEGWMSVNGDRIDKIEATWNRAIELYALWKKE